MEKIAINLLPPEYKAAEAKAAKFYKVQVISVAAVMLVVFLASLALALRILQNQNIKAAQANLTDQEQKVSQLKGRQASLFVLKNRLSAINHYATTSIQAQTYRLLDKLLPPQIVINSLAVDRQGIAFIVAVVQDPLRLDTLISNLISKEAEGQVSEVSIESLNRGRDGIYRISFKVKPK